MAMRPGDSAPDLDRIEGRAAPDAAGAAHPDDHGLPDSHIFQMPVMVPHLSDGTTDVLKKGRAVPRVEEVSDATEPMFPRQSAESREAEPAGDDDVTLELSRVPRAAAAADLEQTVSMPAVPPSRPASAPSAATAAAAPPVQSGGNLLVLLLLSYASAITIALVYLLATRDPETLRRHQLEDLRDPVDEAGTVRIYQRGAELPPGHVLTLGQSQRFGHVLVEPLRVTQGPVEFDHYSKNANKQQPATPPVYKLWLRLTNVSPEQSVAPLDALLMFKRELNKAGELVSNTFVSPRGRAEAGPVVFAYPAAQDSEWDMRGQSLGRVLAPGESVETYIPSDAEGLEHLAEADELAWRFHLRKGLAPSGRGVTTLVEVTFTPDAVQTEAPDVPPAAAPEPERKRNQERRRKGDSENRESVQSVAPGSGVSSSHPTPVV